MTGTPSGTDLSLRSLRDRPFELLKELEKRSRSVTAGNAPEAAAGSRVGWSRVPHGWGDISGGARGNPGRFSAIRL